MFTKILFTSLLTVGLYSFSTNYSFESSVSKKKSGFPYASKDKNISITMPAEFKASSENGTTKVTTILEANSYLFAYTKHTTPLEKPEELAKAGLEAFNKQLNGKIESRDAYKYKKYKGDAAKISIEGLGFCIYKTVVIGNYQFQATVIGPEDNFGKTEASFFKSFKFKG